MELEEQEDVAQVEKTSSPGVAGWVGVILLFLVFGLVAYRVYPGSRPRQTDPGFIDIIFANNLVVFAARLALFLAAVVLAVTAVFIVRSMAARMRAGQHLAQFGPLRVQEVEDLSQEVDFWQEAWAETDAENKELRAQLERTDNVAQELWAALQVAQGGEEPQTGDEPEEDLPVER